MQEGLYHLPDTLFQKSTREDVLHEVGVNISPGATAFHLKRITIPRGTVSTHYRQCSIKTRARLKRNSEELKPYLRYNIGFLIKWCLKYPPFILNSLIIKENKRTG